MGARIRSEDFDSPKVLRFSIDINSSVLGSSWAKVVCSEVKWVVRIRVAVDISL
jgi:hypothetical protein